MQKVITNSNLNPSLKLFFYLPILINNNLLLKIYYENIVIVFFNQDFLFFILFFFLSFHFHPYTFHFFFSFSCFSPPHKCLVSTHISIPPFFYFLFHLKNILATMFTSHQRERERERVLLVRRPTASGDRGHRKDKAGGDRRSPYNVTTNAALPPLVLLPTTRLGQIGLFFFFLFFFFFIFACSNSTLFQELDFFLCLDYVRNGENERKKKSRGERKN